MLFDLRNPGRRRTIKTIYLALAVLMAAGLILFGIGGAVSGGLLDALGGSGGGGSDSTLSNQQERLDKRVHRNPQDAHAWAALARVRYQQVVQGDGYDQQTGGFTAQGRKELAGVVAAWSRYMALDPKHPSSQTAALMVRAFTELGKYGKALDAQQIVVAAAKQPTAGAYYQLAQLAYAAGNNRQGDLSAQKAVELTHGKTARLGIRNQLKALKKQMKKANAEKKAASEAAPSTGATSTTGTATTGG